MELPKRAQKLEWNLNTIIQLVTLIGMCAGGVAIWVNKDGLRRVVGTDLIGARGVTPEDQRKIDRTVVGICAAAVWTKAECERHGERG